MATLLAVGLLGATVDEPVCVGAFTECASQPCDQLEGLRLPGLNDPPLILRGCAVNWHGLGLESREVLAREFGNAEVRVGSYTPIQLQIKGDMGWGEGDGLKMGTLNTTTLSDLLAGKHTRNAFDAMEGNLGGRIIERIRKEKTTTTTKKKKKKKDDEDEEGDAAAQATKRWVARLKYHEPLVSIGPVGSSVGFHYHGSAWLYLARGEKVWFFAPHDDPPAVEHYWVNPEEWPADSVPASATQCTQRAGDLMLLPPMIHHATLNRGETFGFGGNGHAQDSEDRNQPRRFLERNHIKTDPARLDDLSRLQSEIRRLHAYNVNEVAWDVDVLLQSAFAISSGAARGRKASRANAAMHRFLAFVRKQAEHVCMCAWMHMPYMHMPYMHRFLALVRKQTERGVITRVDAALAAAALLHSLQPFRAKRAKMLEQLSPGFVEKWWQEIWRLDDEFDPYRLREGGSWR